MANDFFDAVVQLDLEHEPSKLGVAGSSPVSAIRTRKRSKHPQETFVCVNMNGRTYCVKLSVQLGQRASLKV